MKDCMDVDPHIQCVSTLTMSNDLTLIFLGFYKYVHGITKHKSRLNLCNGKYVSGTKNKTKNIYIKNLNSTIPLSSSGWKAFLGSISGPSPQAEPCCETNLCVRPLHCAAGPKPSTLSSIPCSSLWSGIVGRASRWFAAWRIIGTAQWGESGDPGRHWLPLLSLRV